MMPGKYSLKGKISTRWNSLFLKAFDCDRTGRIPDAIIQYQSTAAAIESDLLQVQEVFRYDQLYNIKKACACFRVRARTLQNMNQCDPMAIAEIQKLAPMMKHFTSWKAPFPLVVHQSDFSDDNSSASSFRSLNSINQVDDEELIASNNVIGNPLLPMLNPQFGKHRVTIKIESIGAKRAERLIQPFLSICVKDDVGLCISPTQEIRNPSSVESCLVSYGQELHIQRYLEDIYKGSAIYFELKHYKQKRRLVDTKCYSLLDYKSISGGDYVLNLFKKPVQYSSKNRTLMSTKPLYLRIHVTIHDD